MDFQSYFGHPMDMHKLYVEAVLIGLVPKPELLTTVKSSFIQGFLKKECYGINVLLKIALQRMKHSWTYACSRYYANGDKIVTKF